MLMTVAAAASSRADEPLNPLRTNLSVVPVSPVSATRGEAGLLPGEQSVVPARFGPELAPLPPDGYAEDVGQTPFLPGEDPWSGPLVHRWFVHPWFAHSDPNDPERHIGLGQPLIGTSWRNRPMYFGLFAGGVLTDDLVPGHVDQNDTSFTGLRLGADFDHYWGVEFRYAFARPELMTGAGDPINGDGRSYFADVELIHYPWGDSRWRPYVLAGLGFQTYRFHDDQAERVSEALLSIPIGAGLKYYWAPWFSLRFDFVDNIAVGNEQVSGMHNISFMAGGEFRFGGRRQSYFPWHNNTTYW